jgi:hypothetical protein
VDTITHLFTLLYHIIVNLSSFISTNTTGITLGCGLVGVAGKLEFRDEALMRRLLVLDYFRGVDSTGMAAIRADDSLHLAKIASHPIDLFDTGKFKAALSGHNSKAFIGHNRAATKGGVNAVNAHPFECGHIIGAHNGTLDRLSWNRLQDASGEKFDVDSHAIFKAIEVIGIDETVKLMEEGSTSVDGAWSLVWFDLKENTLNFLRNKHRPLWYAYTKNFDRVFWASEHEMIRTATEMSTNPYEIFMNTEGFRYFATQENWLYQFDMAKMRKATGGRPKPKVRELKGREPIRSYAGNVSNFPQRTPHGSSGSGQSTTTSTGSKTSSDETGSKSGTGSGTHNAVRSLRIMPSMAALTVRSLSCTKT